ncbi:hypothetical protein D3C78_334740 [compost metagenome]
MAIGFVVVQAIGQPDDGLHRQVLTQDLFDLLTVQVRVAVAVEQALFGSDQGALTVHMDRAALKHEAFGLVALATLHFQHLGCQLLIAVPRRVQAAVEAAPGVEAPIHTAHFARIVDDEGRAGITHPGVVVADFHHTDVGQVQLTAGVFVLAGRNSNGNRLEAGDGFGQGDVGSLGRLASQAPVVRTLGPDHPHLALRRPFGGHVETVGAGGGVEGFHG